jgi:hypothetical protein
MIYMTTIDEILLRICLPYQREDIKIYLRKKLHLC